MARSDLYESVTDIYYNTPTKGLLKDPDFYTNFYTANMVYYTIPIQFQYRPDLIAYKFYKDSSLDWILTYANQFKNSPEDYVAGISILIPELTRIKQLI